MIRFENVTKIYAPNNITIDNLSFKIDSGQRVLITGDAATGKSTLIKLIAGFENLTSGSVLINDVEIGNLNRKNKMTLRHHIGIIYQQPKMLEGLNVFDNVMLSVSIVGKITNHNQAIEQVNTALNNVGLGHKMFCDTSQLSGSELQKVNIARAIVNNPRIIVADEPTTFLDPANKQRFFKILDILHRQGTTVVIASTDSEVHTLAYDQKIHLTKQLSRG